MYQNSIDHLFNMEQAREKALKIKISCIYCGEQRTKANINKHQDSCYLNPSNKRYCEVCNNPIKNYKTSKTCSYSCSNKLFRTGPNNGNWKDDYYRTTCFHHHERKCVICSEENIVEVHHLDENHKNNEPNNLVPLCPTHHQYWHSKYRYLVEDKINNYIKNWSLG